MSIQSARDFLTKVTKDEEFRTRLRGCKAGADQYQFAQGAGFEFTVDEIRTAGNELQDSDLEVISGGCWAACETQECRNYGPLGY